jgi:membrane protease YdiL (CAAX protease family)
MWTYRVAAPVIEEMLYRIVICVPLVALAGFWGAALISRAVFAGLHFMYGNPAPDNSIAGYVLAWAFLKSGSIIVPVFLHTTGNACAFVVQVINWHIQ